MRLYDRDYTQLTNEEFKRWKELKEQEKVKIGNLIVKKSQFRNYPKAVRHYESLFPNHYLDIIDLQEIENLNNYLKNFIQLLGKTSSNEQDILNYINRNRAYYIIGSILKNYSFGHHDAFIFPEFPLGNSYRVDYLLIGRSSGGYEFVFVELEHPNNKIFLKDGTEGEAFRKGIKQVKDWRRWLEMYFSSLQETFNKYINPNIESLPKEFLIPDYTRYHYVVVAGKRTDFEKNRDVTYREKRERSKEGIQILHYDNLIDMARRIIGKATY